jgi:erythromycin esterase-like protein
MTRRADIQALRAAALPLSRDDDHAALLGLVGDARIVLLGEASHGTHEFYRERVRITQRLIAERGFRAVAVEGDWPDAYRVDRFVRGKSGDASAPEALAGFRRFPTWMWRNTDVAGFADWLRDNADNAGRADALQCGFYGLDMYSLHASIEKVLAYLQREHPALAALARERYACFDRFGQDSQVYGMMTGLRGAEDCEEAVVAMLVDLRANLGEAEAAFDAEQNARLVRNAESYYRRMYMRNVSSWNLRDTHMAETLQALEQHLARDGAAAKVVVWAHNSHVGDARATEMGRQRDELNLGQLVRERLGDDAFLVGFTTHAGTVTAASDWDAEAEHKRVRPSLPGSVERLLHDTGIGRFVLPLRGDGAHVQVLGETLLERAIGVIYRPETERQSHYFDAEPARQFDALVHLDETHAVRPLDRHAAWHAAADAPETYPFGT